MIGDADPEDAYDATDPLPERLRVLAVIVAHLLAERASNPPRAERRRNDAVRVLRGILADLQAV